MTPDAEYACAVCGIHYARIEDARWCERVHAYKGTPIPEQVGAMKVPCTPCFGGNHEACWKQPCCCMRHPLDIEIVDMAEHLRQCKPCRHGFARIMYERPPARN